MSHHQNDCAAVAEGFCPKCLRELKPETPILLGFQGKEDVVPKFADWSLVSGSCESCEIRWMLFPGNQLASYGKNDDHRTFRLRSV